MTAPIIQRREPALVLVFSILTLAIQQDQINRVVEKLEKRLASDAGAPA